MLCIFKLKYVVVVEKIEKFFIKSLLFGFYLKIYEQ